MKFKKLFSTPKRIATTAGISVLALGFLGAVSFISVYAIAESNSIGKEAAVQNAYAAAGLSSNEIDAVEAKFKFDDGKFVYDVEFYSKGKEYEYKIHSKNGSVVEFEHSKNHNLPKESISVDEAKNVALSHAGLKIEDVTFTKAKLDKDDNVFKYELEFTTSEKKYEYDISATDGTVISTQIKSLFFDESSVEPENLVSIETAKENALSHAGITDAIFTKAHLSREEEAYKYNIHFISENTEYKYTIDGANGEIIKSSKKDINASEGVKISIEDAKNVALSHANLTKDMVRFMKSELDEEDGIYVYEIEFSYENKKYEYEINANTSEIIKTQTKNDIPAHELLGIEKAKEISLNHAEVSQNDAVFDKAELDEKNGMFFYEIKFKTDGFKYSYEINASNGKIIKHSKNDISSDLDKPAISHDEAKDIAFSDAGITIPNHPHVFKEDFEVDEREFEIEFSTEKGKFKYEINAHTGEITKKEFIPNIKPNQNQKLIGIEDAKDKALKHFSISKNEVTFTKAKLERDNGIAEYDIEFIYNGKKYEVSVDAASGNINEYETN